MGPTPIDPFGPNGKKSRKAFGHLHEFSSLQNSFDAFLATPMHHFAGITSDAKMLERLAGEQSSIQRQFEAMNSDAKRISDALGRSFEQRSLEAIIGLSNTIDSWAEKFGTAVSASTALDELAKHVASDSALFSLSQNAFSAESLRMHFNPDLNQIARLAAQSDDIWERVSDAFANPPTPQVVSEKGNEVVSQVIAGDDHATAAGVLRNVVAKIEKIPDQRLRIFLSLFYVPWLAKALAAIALTAIGAALGAAFAPIAQDMHNERKEAALRAKVDKACRETIRNVIGDARLLSNVRIVTCKRDTLHINPKPRSPVIGTLVFGDIVEVRERKGNYVYIFKAGTPISPAAEGWVSTRHLRKMDK